MKTKAKIVQDLLDKDLISAEDAVVLLTPSTMFPNPTPKDSNPLPYTPYPSTPIPYNPTPTNTPYNPEIYYEKCSCNPKNGGVGVCGCILNTWVTYTST